MAEPEHLAAIHAACFTTPRPWSAAEFAALLALPHMFLLTDDAVAPSALLLGSAIAGEAELLTLAVRPDARRLGSGRRLLQQFLAQARARGASDIFLEVAADNAAAIALYDSAGFQRSGLRRGYYHNPTGAAVDALVMTRQAPAPAASA